MKPLFWSRWVFSTWAPFPARVWCFCRCLSLTFPAEGAAGLRGELLSQEMPQ